MIRWLADEIHEFGPATHSFSLIYFTGCCEEKAREKIIMYTTLSLLVEK